MFCLTAAHSEVLIENFVASCATIWARDETSSLRNIRFKACFTKFSVIQSSLPISRWFVPKQPIQKFAIHAVLSDYFCNSAITALQSKQTSAANYTY